GNLTAIEGEQRGSMSLYGGNGVTVASGAHLTADARAGSGRGGDIEIGSIGGSIDLAPGSVISANGPALHGTRTLRAAATASDIAIDRVASTFSNVREVVLAPVFSTDIVGGTLSDAELGGMLSAATSYVDAFGETVLSRLNPNGSAPM